MKMYRNEVTIGNDKRVVVTINQNEDKEVKTTKKLVSQLHHIHILDRSGSMCGEINRLIDNVQKTLEVIDDDDLLSIIWFSSPGEFKTLIKGARKTDNLKDLLNSIRFTLGTTCFSDPIKEAHVIVNDLMMLCSNVSITLFTDGRPCGVPWGEVEEEKRVLSELGKMREKILACNTIGYGCYYNQDFLRNIAAASEFGSFIHSRDINEYLHIFQQNFEKVVETTLEKIKIEYSGDIVYLNRKFTKKDTGTFELSRLDKEKNQFFLIGDGDFDFTYQGERYNSKKLKTEAPEATITNFLYALAYNVYYAGKRQYALDILAHSLMDKRLLEMQLNAFTFDEVADYTEILYGAVFNTSERWVDGKCKKGVLPKPDAHNVMDVLSALATSNAYYLPYHDDAQEYERIGKKVTDNFNLFQWNDEVVKASFDELVFHKSKINVSIKMRINGTVQLNPKEAKQHELTEVFNSHIYRTHTIIKDGSLNLKKVVVLLPERTFDELLQKKTKITKTKLDKVTLDWAKQEHGEKFVCAIINFKGLPMINRMYLNDSMNVDNVFSACSDILLAESYQKVLKYYIDKVEEVSAVAKKEKAFKDYTVEQIKVLEAHGVDTSGAYKGVNNVAPKNAECDSYEARSVEFVFDGISALPSMNALEKRLAEIKQAQITKAKKIPTLTTGMQLLADAKERMLKILSTKKLDIETLNVPLKKALEHELQIVRSELLAKRTQINAIKMAKVLTGDWFEGLGNDGKGNYTYEKEERTLLLKTEMVKEYF